MRIKDAEKFNSPRRAFISMLASLDRVDVNKCPSINRDFCSRSKHAKKITTGICLIFRGLFFSRNAEIGQVREPARLRKDHLWMDSNKGFTLIETLVAISILSISLVVILQLFSGGLKSSRLSDDYTRGIFHAMEKMEEILLADEITDGVFEGEFEDGFRWTAEIIHLESEEPEEETIKGPFDTFRIKVDIGWKMGSNEKHYEISTIKVTEKIKITG